VSPPAEPGVYLKAIIKKLSNSFLVTERSLAKREYPIPKYVYTTTMAPHFFFTLAVWYKERLFNTKCMAINKSSLIIALIIELAHLLEQRSRILYYIDPKYFYNFCLGVIHRQEPTLDWVVPFRA
jgi:hypothetical protein